ncbi:MAG TPA: leucine--tRNA ligase, partial [Bacteroidetes bacterium]|nr:leucine--tRNA ligase [Bacteroidota bacterium]
TNKSEILLPMIKLIAPFAPFIAEELWSMAGKEGSVHHQKFPKYDEGHLVEAFDTYPISVNGKKRGIEKFPKNISKEELEKNALNLDYVKKWTEGKKILKVIVVPGRMINIVVK